MQQLVCLFLLPLPLLAGSSADRTGQTATKFIIDEGSDVILPCSVSTKVDITSDRFDWKKDGKMEVFLYDRGTHYANGRDGQDQQFKGRVEPFQNELKSGNASITINDTKVADNGTYTCIFPDLQGGSTVSTVHLVIRSTLKDRTAENISGASPRPYTMMGNATDGGVPLKCEVLGAYPQPTLQWQDSDGKVLQSDKPQVTENGGRYVSLQITVKQTETKRFVCVSTQEAISHTVKAEITVPGRCEAPGLSVRDVIVFVLGCAVGAVGIGGIGGTVVYFKYFRKGGERSNSSTSSTGAPGDEGLQMVNTESHGKQEPTETRKRKDQNTNGVL